GDGDPRFEHQPRGAFLRGREIGPTCSECSSGRTVRGWRNGGRLRYFSCKRIRIAQKANAAEGRACAGQRFVDRGGGSSTCVDARHAGQAFSRNRGSEDRSLVSASPRLQVQPVL